MAEAYDQGQRLAWLSWRPHAEAVDALIRVARQHELGLEFLRRGAQDAVAAVFQVHAFLVDAARERLARAPRSPGALCGIAPDEAAPGPPPG